MSRTSFLYRNSLSIVLITLMIIFLAGQFFMGWKTENKELIENGQPVLKIGEYIHSGHFIQATFENWESEFLQMMLYVLLTISLRQKGSSESKSMTEEEDVDKEPVPHPQAPWPVKKAEYGCNSTNIRYQLLLLSFFWRVSFCISMAVLRILMMNK